MIHSTNQKGQILIVVAIALAILIGIAAVAIDGGLLLVERARAQHAADVGALAGAAAYCTGKDLVTAANNAAALNGFTNSGSSQSVTVNHPPKSGPYAGKISYVEVVVSSDYTPALAQVLYTGAFTNTVRAVSRCVPGGVHPPGNGNYGIIALNKNALGGVYNNGSGTVRVEEGDIFVNSSNAKAIYNNGSGSIRAPHGSIYVVGGIHDNGSGEINPWPVKADQMDDPMTEWVQENTPAGSAPGCDQTADFNGSTAHTINPGNYRYISNNGSGALTLNPGTYHICAGGRFSNNGSGDITLGSSSAGVTLNFYGDAYHSDNGSGKIKAPYGLTLHAFGSGGILLNGSGSLTANGPGGFFTYLKSGDFEMNGSGTFNVKAPSSGDYKNLSLFSMGGEVIVNGSGSSMSYGTLYAPNALCLLNGSGNATAFHSQYICDRVKNNGSGTFKVAYYPGENFGLPSGPLIEITE